MDTTNNGSLMDVLKGDKALQFSISLDFASISYLLGGAFAVGLILVLISKKIK